MLLCPRYFVTQTFGASNSPRPGRLAQRAQRATQSSFLGLGVLASPNERDRTRCVATPTVSAEALEEICLQVANALVRSRRSLLACGASVLVY